MPTGKLTSRDLMRTFLAKASPYTAPANYFIGLSTADPTTDGSGNAEPSGGAYAAVSTATADYNDPTNADPSVADNANAITFPQATADWSGGSNMTHFGIWRHATNRAETDFLWSGALAVAKPVLNGDTASFAVGQLQLQMGS